jgi:hypothetical protein
MALAGALALIGALGPSRAAPPATAQAGLFSDAARPPADISAEMDRTVVRSRYVDVNLGLMDGTPRTRGTPLGRGDVLTLNLFNYSSALFPDVTVTAVRDRVEPSSTGHGFVWVGHVQGEDPAFGPVTLAVENGAMAGNVRAGGRTYQVRGTPGGGQIIYEVTERDVPSHEHIYLSAAAVRAAAAVQASAPRAAVTKAPGAVADTGSTLDVLVAYTAQARADAGGTAQIQAQINTAIAETNTAYQNSQISQFMRLVGTLEVTYTSAGLTINGLATDLRCVAGTVTVGGGDQIDPTSTCLSDVRAQRTALQADIVSLWVEGQLTGSGTVGIGYVMSNNVLVNGQPNPSFFSGFAFSVVARRYAMALNYTFAHETGHNLGANHDHVTDAAVTNAIYPFAFDSIPANNAFHTIMAYPDKCGGCPAIQYYSNPNLTVQGQTIGVAGNGSNAADNHQTMINTINAAINFRQCNQQPCGATPTTGPSPTATATTAPLTNDAFANATLVSGLPAQITQSTTIATVENGEPGPSCVTSVSHTVWFRFTPSAMTQVTVSTVGSSFDTVVGVFTGSALNGLTRIACDDDSGGNATSRLTFPATAGTTYRIQVGSFSTSNGGTLVLNLSGVTATATPTATTSPTPGGELHAAAQRDGERRERGHYPPGLRHRGRHAGVRPAIAAASVRRRDERHA